MLNIRKIGKGIAFLVVFVALFLCFQSVLQPKWYGNTKVPGVYGTTTRWNELYSLEKNSVDVFFVGTSHTYCGVDPMYLYENTGITSFDLAGSDVRMDALYTALVDAYEHQSPSLVVLDMSAIHYNKAGSEARAHMVLDQLPLSLNKLKYAFSNKNKELKPLEALFPLLRYHSRWSELGKNDADYYAGNVSQGVARGYSVNYIQKAAQLQFDNSKKFKLTKHNREYLDKIVELCKEHGSELVLMKIPAPRWTQAQSEFCKNYAEENGLTYLELYDSISEIGLDCTMDFRDNHDHLNQYGAEKVTAYLAGYITENYQMEDRRGKDERWDKDYLSYAAIRQTRYESALAGDPYMEGVEEG